ncbi:hypothetical protein AVEN_259852-1 [Araneus ventricosus]|uniref:Uncharacterized protein n=1 Tax=Araneus ventricosus TaxID=182803 RepID=A0A4Y2DR85_ARAVE|nr:hypothetical protein AVEN_259852-1 [Araneus ventricosus]
MEKESEKKSSLRPSSEESEQGNSQGFDPKEEEKEPVRILQLSQSFFVADTVEEDESMIIPPTQELLIPNTPPRAETSDKEGNVSNGNDTTSSNLDEVSE